MPVAPSTAGKVPSPAGALRSNRSQATRTSQSLRVTNVSQQTSPLGHAQKSAKEMNNNLLIPPRPPDPTLFIQAGTSGIRHLFPIHLTDNDCNGGVFSRSISRLRSRTPTTELCNNIEMIRNVCLSIKTLQHFDVSENQLNDLPIDISLLTELETLNCSHNQLTDMADIFEQLKRLKELDLSFNLFKYLPNAIYTYKYLIRLNCEHNLITTIDDGLVNLKRLKFFVFDHNQLESIDQVDFGQMKKLEYVHIAHNQLIKFPRGLHQLHHLKNVNLSYNRLTSFPIDLLLVNTLDVLNLSHNLIAKLPSMPVAYTRASMIFSIDLSFNELTKFYDYLLLIALKIDVSNNKIRMISNDIVKKLNNDLITSRELKINNNPLTQPAVPSEMLNENSLNTTNVLRMIRNCFDEQQIDANVRQGFKICIIGPKKSGKTSLANCLEELMPITIDENNEETQERIIHVHQYPIRLITVVDQSSTSKQPTPAPLPPSSVTKTTISSSTKIVELPKIQLQRFEMDARKRKNPSAQVSKQNISVSNQPQPATPSPSTATPRPPVSTEVIKVLPVTVFEFNGSSDYYEHMSPFIDTSALHLICIHTADFHQTTPASIEDIFNGKFDILSSNTITQLFQLLQLLCEKASKTRAIMILPVATCIDLYDKRANQDKIEVLEKINSFFKFYLQYRIDRIKHEMESIHSLHTISSSLSDRLKTYTSLLNITIQIEPCQSISSLTFQGIDELNRTIQRCVLTQKPIFPYVDRILPTLWAETNQYIESLAESLPVPYLLWENYSDRVISKHGLAHLINDITLSLHDEGKILVLNEISTTDRVVFLRPSWLTDLLYNLFRHDMSTTYLDYEKNEIFSLTNLSESNFQTYKKEFLQYGLLHSDLLRSLWFGLLHKKEHFFYLWLTIMRFLLIAYPKMNKGQLKRLIHVQTPDPLLKNEKKSERLIDVKQNPDVREEIKFDYAIVPYYLPLINQNEQQDELKLFTNSLKNIIIIRYTSQSLPLGFFHRFSVSAILRLNIIYKKHWNNFILGEHEEKDVRFLMETDHRTYIICHCGTNIVEQSLEEIWNVLMPILNHFEAVLTNLAPSNLFDRSVQCPHCKKFSFMGEWTTPKELQCIKMKACLLCGQNVDTARLVQPNESKRRSEELLRRIRERHAKNTTKAPDDVQQTTSPTTHLLVSPV
ncbi:unnamed protein product [Rotaria sp. Silwood1]|nr:unnamed protein product [Rotaria sp. Silwood1]CAF4521452.1 unnamed protein product [Rotaria sp. Silwood1]CAF4613416.1 unnamed protein product [Rotaria sp. Silwood1]